MVLVRYAAPTGFTARNSLEADIAARIAARLSAIMVSNAAPVGPEYFAAEGFAILAPHRAQNAAIQMCIRDRR